jgi:hypothetical protein
MRPGLAGRVEAVFSRLSPGTTVFHRAGVQLRLAMAGGLIQLFPKSILPAHGRNFAGQRNFALPNRMRLVKTVSSAKR